MSCLHPSFEICEALVCVGFVLKFTSKFRERSHNQNIDLHGLLTSQNT